MNDYDLAEISNHDCRDVLVDVVKYHFSMTGKKEDDVTDILCCKDSTATKKFKLLTLNISLSTQTIFCKMDQHENETVWLCKTPHLLVYWLLLMILCF